MAARNELIGYFGVESSKVLIGDPCHLGLFINNDFVGELPSKVVDRSYSYSGACSVAYSDKSGGQLGGGRAVVVETGRGDGSYPVFAKRDKDGVIKELTIKFF